MQLTHAFELPAPAGRVFDVFSQLNLLAPCFPGATVWGRDGDVYHGAVKIKFGPFPLVFEGTARVVRADVHERRLVVKANARDRRGAAAGAATVTASFRPAEGDATAVDVLTELDLTGRPAQLGTGTVASVSDRLKDQFVGCLSGKLAAGLTADQPAAGAADTARTAESAETAETAETAGTAGTAGTAIAGAGPSASPTRALRPDYAYVPPADAESAPHLQVLPDVARTWLPRLGGVVGGLALLVLLVRWLRGR